MLKKGYAGPDVSPRYATTYKREIPCTCSQEQLFSTQERVQIKLRNIIFSDLVNACRQISKFEMEKLDNSGE